MRSLKLLVGIIACWLIGGSFLSAQTAQIKATEESYDFGAIREEAGPVNHTFVVKNTGAGALVINRVLASCGCTQPEWTVAPIAPGKTGEISVTYDPKGRPGPFKKSVIILSNSPEKRLKLYISGEVIPKGEAPTATFTHSIGKLELSKSGVQFNMVSLGVPRRERLWVKNTGTQDINIHFDHLPNYLQISVQPATIQAGGIAEMEVLIDATKLRKPGHLSVQPQLSTRNNGKTVDAAQPFPISANVVGDFSKLTAAEKAKAPSIQLSGTVLRFGKIEEKGFLSGLFGKKVTGTIEISNSGKETLVLYSITPDNPLLDVTGYKKEIKPGGKTTIKVNLHPKEINQPIEALIMIVCNDPNGPVRQVRVSAE